MRKRTKRIDIGHEVKVRHDNGQAEATILNVSYGGVLISSTLKLSVTDAVTIIHDEAGELNGSVVRNTDTGFAVQFIEDEDSANFALNSITSKMFADHTPDEIDHPETDDGQE